MAISAARAAAFDILLRVEGESSYASELLHTSAYERLTPVDHALTTELVMGVLRWRSLLDNRIGQASSHAITKLDLEILIALRIALYQMLWLTRIPSRAAIHESVELVKRARKRSAAPFVNAVLRKLCAVSEVSQEDSAANTLPTSVEHLARSQAHPLWLVERWSAQYGLATAASICRYDQSIPVRAIRLRDRAAEKELEQEGIHLAPGALLRSARRVQSGDVTKTRAFRERRIVTQDEASQLVAALVGSGTRILDCCAAPGGKTLVLSDENPTAMIAAVELHPHRARLLRKLLPDRVAGDGMRIRVVIADARHLPTHGQFDRILADLPCSGTGTLARNPEIKWRLQPNDLADLAQRQPAILKEALSQLAPGGRCVYSTCSLEKEENENVIEQVVERNRSIRLLDCRDELDRMASEGELIWSTLASLTSGPYLRTLPGVHPCEGFFAAILERI